jgi:hypothetical protein
MMFVVDRIVYYWIVKSATFSFSVNSAGNAFSLKKFDLFARRAIA